MFLFDRPIHPSSNKLSCLRLLVSYDIKFPGWKFCFFKKKADLFFHKEHVNHINEIRKFKKIIDLRLDWVDSTIQEGKQLLRKPLSISIQKVENIDLKEQTTAVSISRK